MTLCTSFSFGRALRRKVSFPSFFPSLLSRSSRFRSQDFSCRRPHRPSCLPSRPPPVCSPHPRRTNYCTTVPGCNSISFLLVHFHLCTRTQRPPPIVSGLRILGFPGRLTHWSSRFLWDDVDGVLPQQRRVFRVYRLPRPTWSCLPVRSSVFDSEVPGSEPKSPGPDPCFLRWRGKNESPNFRLPAPTSKADGGNDRLWSLVLPGSLDREGNPVTDSRGSSQRAHVPRSSRTRRPAGRPARETGPLEVPERTASPPR